MSRLLVYPFGFAVLLAIATRAGGAVINSNTTIDAGNSFPDETVIVLDGEDPPTIVEILPGAVVGRVHASDTSVVNINGGTFSEGLNVTADATINLIGGTVVGPVFADVNGTFNMSGGQVDDVRILSDSPTVNISGGVILDDIDTQMFSGGTINLTGGEVRESLRVAGKSMVNWWGGSFRSGAAWDEGRLNVFGVGLTYDDDRIGGTLADGTVVDVFFSLGSGTTRGVVLHEVNDASGDTFPLDGVVNIVDLNQVRNHFGAGHIGGDPVPGDTFPFDGAVDMNDLNRVRNRFGTNRPATPVPEPATATMLLLSITALFLASRWRPKGA